MNGHDAPRLTDEAVAALSEATVRLAAGVRHAVATGALRRLGEQRPGPGSGASGNGHAGPAYSDPTATAALAGHRDVAGAHRAEIERQLVRAVAALRQAADVCARYPVPMPAPGVPEPGCESCARLRGPAGGHRWEPPDRRLSGPTDAGGRLPEKHYLCAWCHDKARAWGRLPTGAELEAHHAGRRVAWPKDVPQPIRRRSV